jgi:uncharacterized protein YjdB
VATIALSPTSLVLQVGEAFSISAVPRDAAGHPVVGRTPTWSSSATGIVTVAASGIVNAVAAGSAVITATIGETTGSLTVLVIPLVRRVVVGPATPTVEVGGALTLSMALLDALENQINATVAVTWTSSDTAKATVNATGVVTPKQTGTVVITASFSTNLVTSMSGNTTVTIVPHVPTVSVNILPNPVGLVVGQTRALTAFARGQNGAAIPGRTFTWATTSPNVLSVSSSGVVTALNPGAGTVSATSEGITATTSLTLFSATPAAGIGVGFGLEQFVTIPAGSFSMGSTSGNLDELPVRTVTLTTPFKMQRTEVTRSQWLSVMGSVPAGNTGCDLCPVANVTWDQAQTFVTALNVANPGAGFRLPTEAQWEFAARGGVVPPADYPGELELIAQYIVTSESRVWPVALREPNALGLYDVIGNVAEWTLDWYRGAPDAYAGLGTVDPIGFPAGTIHVNRGGSYTSAPFTARSASRGGTLAGASALVGFRLARN